MDKRILHYKAAKYKKVMLGLCIGSVAIACVVYFVSAKYYEYTQYHYFDPYYQTPINVSDYIATQKEENEIRILVLGGSTTANRFIPYSNRYTTILEQSLNKAFPNKKITVINGGMDWHTMKHAAISFITEYRSYEPDMVLVLHGINDLYRSFAPSKYAMGTYKEDYSHFYGSSINGANPPSYEKYIYTKYFENYFDQYVFSYTALEYPVEEFVALKSFEKYTTNLLQVLKADGRMCVVMNQPSLYKESMPQHEENKLWFGKYFCNRKVGWLAYEYPNANSMKTALDSANNILKSIAADENCLFLDLDAAIPKDTSYYNDDVHFTEKANSLIGNFIAQQLTPVLAHQDSDSGETLSFFA